MFTGSLLIGTASLRQYPPSVQVTLYVIEHKGTEPASVTVGILAHELRRQGLQVERQVSVRGIRFEEGFRADLVIENPVIIELNCVERLTNAHKKQLLTYLRVTDVKRGYLLNSGAAFRKDGITRTVNRLLEEDRGRVRTLDTMLGMA